MSEKIYIVFKRSCRNWEEFASARKYTIRKGLTYDEALSLCKQLNANLTQAQIKRGTKFEFTSK
jgi:hypothetical protein